MKARVTVSGLQCRPRRRRQAIVTARVLMTLWAAAIGSLAGPVADASASCATAAECAVETGYNTAMSVVGLATSEVQSVQNFVQQQAQGQDVVCLVQGRWYPGLWPSTATGTADCFVYDGRIPAPGSPAYEHGTFRSEWVELAPGLGTPYLHLNSDPTNGLNYGQFNTTLTDLTTTALAGGAAVYSGGWHTYNVTPERNGTAKGLLHAFPAATLDPQGGDDYFVHGVWILSNQGIPG
jgi:hypothetical protein